jgi:phytoene/squalene synthetase
MSLLAPRVVVDPATGYDELARASASLVIQRYSSSFGLASKLLGAGVREHVRCVYALVRVADEVVDAPRDGSGPAEQRALLDALEADLHRALDTGHSANLVVHAFAGTARTCGIGSELTGPFFESMRTDLERREHDATSFARYVYGSAEVVGLMCLRVFLAAEPDPVTRYAELAPGARALGAAFQKVNFLRDLAEDSALLGRRYFPGVDPERLTDAERDRILDDVDGDLQVAAAALSRLPESSRRGVRAAHAVFAELSRRLRATPAAEIAQRRVRVPAAAKAFVVARAVTGRRA